MRKSGKEPLSLFRGVDSVVCALLWLYIDEGYCKVAEMFL